MMTTGEIHEGPLAPAAPAPARLTWREQRRRRRRRRKIGEEVLGWILVPAILVAGYVAVTAGLSAIGTTPSAVIEQAKLVKQAIDRKNGL